MINNKTERGLAATLSGHLGEIGKRKWKTWSDPEAYCVEPVDHHLTWAFSRTRKGYICLIREYDDKFFFSLVGSIDSYIDERTRIKRSNTTGFLYNLRSPSLREAWEIFRKTVKL